MLLEGSGRSERAIGGEGREERTKDEEKRGAGIGDDVGRRGRGDGSPDFDDCAAATGGGLHRTNSAITDSGFLSQSSLNGSSTSPTSKINGASNGGGSSGSLHKLPGLTGAEKVNLLNRYD